MKFRLHQLRAAATPTLRSALKNWGRSLLVVVMVALPIAGISGSTTLAASSIATPLQRANLELGAAQASIQVVNRPDQTLEQSPTDATWWQIERDDKGTPTHKEGALVRDPAALFPSGTALERLQNISVSLQAGSNQVGMEAIEGPAWKSLFRGRYELLSGRAPRSDTEVLATPAALAKLSLEVGDKVALVLPKHRSLTIVGVIADRTVPRTTAEVVGTAGAFESGAAHIAPSVYYLPNTRLSWQAVQRLNTQGITVTSRSVLLDPPDPHTVALSPVSASANAYTLGFGIIIGGFAAFEVILLAGAAFTVSARRKLKSIAIAASLGTPRSALIAANALLGLALGFVGGFVGIAFGALGAWLFMIVTGDGSATKYPGYNLPVLSWIGALSLAAVVGLIAAVIPAISSSKVDIVGVLRGASRPPKVSRRRPIVGALLSFAGLATTLIGGVLYVALKDQLPVFYITFVLMLIGPVLIQTGVLFAGPSVLRLIAKLMDKGPISARLAARDAARNPTRSVPAFAATMSAVFIAVVGMSYIGSMQLSETEHYQYSTAPHELSVPLSHRDQENGLSIIPYAPTTLLRATVENAIDLKSLRTLRSVPGNPTDTSSDQSLIRVPSENLCPDQPGSKAHGNYQRLSPEAQKADVASDARCSVPFITEIGADQIYVGDAADLSEILGHKPSGTDIATLRAGGAVSFYPGLVSGGHIDIDWWSPSQWTNDDVQDGKSKPRRSATLAAVTERTAHPIRFGILISPQTATRLDLPNGPAMLLGQMRGDPTTDDLASLNRTLQAATGGNKDIAAVYESGPPQFAAQWITAFLALSAGTAIGASAIALSLARFDGQRDAQLLTTLGANESTRRGFAFWQAAVLAGFGSIAGALIGLVPAIALSAYNSFPLAPPWLPIFALVFGMPIAVAGGAAVWLRKSTQRSQRLLD